MSTLADAPAPPAQRFAAVCAILDRFGRDPARLIPILQAVQEEDRYLPQEVMGFVATALGLSQARVFGVATCYAHFALAPKGRFVIKVCDGTACHVKESVPILDDLRGALKLSEKVQTTADLKFTVEKVSCLGACGLAPVMMVGEAVHGQVTPATATAVLARLSQEPS